MSSTRQRTQQISGAGLPAGTVIASHARYAEAQRAVDHLSDEELDVSGLSIVGHDLATLEKVTGRLTYPRVALMSAGQGAFMGLFFGMILTLFGSGGALSIVLTMVMGAAFWMLLGVISYAAQRGRRDFTSMSTIVATRYEVLARPDMAQQAAAVLQSAGLQGQIRRGAGQAHAAPGASGTGAAQAGGAQYGTSHDGAPQQGTPQHGAQQHEPGSAERGVARDGAPQGRSQDGQQPWTQAPAASVSRPEETSDGRPLYGVRVSPQEQDAHRGHPDGGADAQQAPEGGAERG